MNNLAKWITRMWCGITPGRTGEAKPCNSLGAGGVKKLISLTFILLIGYSGVWAEGVPNKEQPKYPDVWMKVFPNPAKERVIGLLKVYGEDAQAAPEIIMQVTRFTSRHGKKKADNYAVGFFDGKEYGLFHPYIAELVKKGKQFESGFHLQSSLEGLKLGDGTKLIGLGYSCGRVCDGNPLTSGAIALDVDYSDARRVNWPDKRNPDTSAPEPLWAKFVVMRVQGRCCIDYTEDILNLEDGTILVQLRTLAIRLNIKDGSCPKRHKDVRIVDYDEAKKFIEGLVEQGEKTRDYPDLNRMVLQKYFK